MSERKRLKTDDIDKFYEYGINIPLRTLYMGSAYFGENGDESGVDGAMAEKVIKGLHLLDNVDRGSETGDKPILILMNNPGGDLVSGQAIFDAVSACRNHVEIRVYGHAMSMGSVILQAADKRVMSPNSHMMIHYGTMNKGGHAPTVYKWVEWSKKFDTWMEDLYLGKIREKHPKFSRARLHEWLMADTFLSSHEAVHWNLADEVFENDSGA